jgi:hypothetical protein
MEEKIKKTVKDKLLDFAEIFDAFRIIPRGILIAFGYLVYYVIDWYMKLPEPSTQHAALVTTVVGASAAVIGLYNNSGRPWNKKD